jgi:N-acetylneuraminic acid mutarotase
LNGKLYLLGGWNLSNAASASLASVSAFDTVTSTSTWMTDTLTPMPTARNAAAAGVISAQIHVIGGRSPGIRGNDHLSLATHEIYNPLTNSWQTAAAMPTARGGIAAAVLNGKLYVFGGEATTANGSTVSNAVERYDPDTYSSQVLDSMPYRAHGLGAVAVGNVIYVMGGFVAGSDAVGTESRAVPLPATELRKRERRSRLPLHRAQLPGALAMSVERTVSVVSCPPACTLPVTRPSRTRRSHISRSSIGWAWQRLMALLAHCSGRSSGEISRPWRAWA